jgi:diacylglycerol kinase family enzyme
VAKVGDNYFIQRLYVGIEPEQQTSREMKDKYGVFAYAASMAQRSKTVKPADYHVTIDGRSGTFRAIKAYVINSGMMGTGLSVTHDYAIDDGLLDAFFIDTESMRTISGAVDRFLNLKTSAASEHIVQGRRISIDTEPDQPVWTDGEYTGRTPIEIEVLPAALTIAVA